MNCVSIQFQVLLSPPIVVYSPRVLPVYVYDAHADCGKNVRYVNYYGICIVRALVYSFTFSSYTTFSFLYSNKNVNFPNSGAFLVLYAIALAIEGWGVVASLIIYPPFAGAAVSAITLVIAFGFAVSRPCLTLKVCALQ